jgi:hypothetical protein
MSKIHLQSHLSNTTNLIEIYFVENKPDDDKRINIKVDKDFLAYVKNKYKVWKTTKYIMYMHNHLTYIYDLTDDNQLVFSKIMQKYEYAHSKNLLILSYAYSKLPTYLFPCTNDIDDIVEYTINEARISNRISLVLKEDAFESYIYIEYKHCQQVDLDKIEDTINNIISNTYKDYRHK